MLPAIILLPVIEILLDYREVYSHTFEIGAMNNLPIIVTLSILLGGNLFHVSTSVFYMKASEPIYYILYFTCIHFIYNISVSHLPTLPLFYYATVPWALTAVAVLAMFLFHIFMKPRNG